jgi:hypothetical protein
MRYIDHVLVHAVNVLQRKLLNLPAYTGIGVALGGVLTDWPMDPDEGPRLSSQRQHDTLGGRTIESGCLWDPLVISKFT